MFKIEKSPKFAICKLEDIVKCVTRNFIDVFHANQVIKFRHRILGSWDATHYNAIEARKSCKMRLELTKGSYRNINQF